MYPLILKQVKTKIVDGYVTCDSSEIITEHDLPCSQLPTILEF